MDRRADSVGIDWIGTVNVGSKGNWPARCRTCGHEWMASLRAVTTKHGCPQCARRKGAKSRIVPQERRDREAALVNCEWIEPCGQKDVPTAIRCRSCGHEWKARPNNVGTHRSGCPPCSRANRVVNGRPQNRTPQAVLNRQAAENGLRLLELGRGRATPVDTECLTCGHIWKLRPGDIGRFGCPECWRSRRGLALVASQEQRDREADAIDCDWLTRCESAHVPCPIKCRVCGYEWEAKPSNVAKKHRCPNCQVSGLDPLSPSLVYLLFDRRGAAKVGITNTTRIKGGRDGRIKQHAQNGWQVSETWDLPTAVQARKIERAIIEWWRDELDLPPAYKGRDGDTETVDARKVGLDVIRERIEAEIAALG